MAISTFSKIVAAGGLLAGAGLFAYATGVGAPAHSVSLESATGAPTEKAEEQHPLSSQRINSNIVKGTLEDYHYMSRSRWLVAKAIEQYRKACDAVQYDHVQDALEKARKGDIDAVSAVMDVADTCSRQAWKEIWLTVDDPLARRSTCLERWNIPPSEVSMYFKVLTIREALRTISDQEHIDVAVQEIEMKRERIDLLPVDRQIIERDLIFSTYNRLALHLREQANDGDPDDPLFEQLISDGPIKGLVREVIGFWQGAGIESPGWGWDESDFRYLTTAYGVEMPEETP